MDILLVDDHAEVRASLAEFLVQMGHQVAQAGNGREALVSLKAGRPDLVVTDLRMPELDGLGLLDACEDLDNPPPVALMTAFGDADTAVEAMRRGAIDYLRKPVDVRELHRLIDRLDGSAAPAAPVETVDGLVVLGNDMARVVALADRLHQTKDLPCLIEGETGTGKELIARHVHHGGKSMGSSPFVAINCAAIAPGLFEAELFGYASGAFTGAAAGGAVGKAAAAAGGTLFLDEIGELPLEQQAKLLRLLEDRSFYPVGGTKLVRFTGRVVCATNRSLVDRVRVGQFREDLYYRLKVGYLRLPPLRERADTVVQLARRLLERIAHTRGREGMVFSESAEKALAAYAWPGNVRELVHAIERALLVCEGSTIAAADLVSLPSQGIPLQQRLFVLASKRGSKFPPAHHMH